MSDTTLYVFSVPSGEHKIGITNNYTARLKNLQTGNHQVLSASIAFEIPDGKARDIERIMHNELSSYHVSGEWFRVPIQLIGNLFDSVYCAVFADKTEIPQSESEVKTKPKFDRVAYQREYMRKKRAKERGNE